MSLWEYIGAVIDVEALRTGQGAFRSEGEFYQYWRAFPFRIPKAVERQLEKALTEAARERARALGSEQVFVRYRPTPPADRKSDRKSL